MVAYIFLILIQTCLLQSFELILKPQWLFLSSSQTLCHYWVRLSQEIIINGSIKEITILQNQIKTFWEIIHFAIPTFFKVNRVALRYKNKRRFSKQNRSRYEKKDRLFAQKQTPNPSQIPTYSTLRFVRKYKVTSYNQPCDSFVSINSQAITNLAIRL